MFDLCLWHVEKTSFTFDNMSCVLIAHKCSINGTIQTQLVLHRLGVTIQVGVWLADSVQKDEVVLWGHT